MKKIIASTLTCMLTAAVLLLAALPAAHAEEGCVTQGALALTLAQELGYSITDQQAAIDKLTALGIVPGDAWQIDECITGDSAALLRDLNADVANNIELIRGDSDRDQNVTISAGIFATALGQAGLGSMVALATQPPGGGPPPMGGPTTSNMVNTGGGGELPPGAVPPGTQPPGTQPPVQQPPRPNPPAPPASPAVP